MNAGRRLILSLLLFVTLPAFAQAPSPNPDGADPAPFVGLAHIAIRTADIAAAQAFYEKLGFEEIGRMPIRDEATNLFMGLPGDGARLELTMNHDQTEPYEIGTGYGHIAITSHDLDQTLAKLAEQGIEPEKPPYSVREGGSRLCFVRDPDGYRIEIIEQPAVEQTQG